MKNQQQQQRQAAATHENLTHEILCVRKFVRLRYVPYRVILTPGTPSLSFSKLGVVIFQIAKFMPRRIAKLSALSLG